MSADTGTVDTAARTETAERVLQAARTAVGSSADVDVTVEHEHLALTRFANSHIHQNVASDTDTVTLRIHAEGRTAVNATTVTDDAGLAGLVERTVAAVRLSPADPGWAGLSGRAPLPVPTAEPDLATGSRGSGGAGRAGEGVRRRGRRAHLGRVLPEPAGRDGVCEL